MVNVQKEIRGGVCLSTDLFTINVDVYRTELNVVRRTTTTRVQPRSIRQQDHFSFMLKQEVPFQGIVLQDMGNMQILLYREYALVCGDSMRRYTRLVIRLGFSALVDISFDK